MIPVVSFYGYSGSGKTSLLVKVIPVLKKRGYRVAVIKHAHHGFDIDTEGKDSYRFTEAGSDIVVLSSPGRLALLENTVPEYTLEQLIAMTENKADVVLVEGFKGQGAIKINAQDYGDADVAKLADFIHLQIEKGETDKENLRAEPDHPS